MLKRSSRVTGFPAGTARLKTNRSSKSKNENLTPFLERSSSLFGACAPRIREMGATSSLFGSCAQISGLESQFPFRGVFRQQIEERKHDPLVAWFLKNPRAGSNSHPLGLPALPRHSLKNQEASPSRPSVGPWECHLIDSHPSRAFTPNRSGCRESRNDCCMRGHPPKATP